MMKFESDRIRVAEEAYTAAIMKIDNDHLDLYYRLTIWYEEITRGYMKNFKKFMAACKAV